MSLQLEIQQAAVNFRLPHPILVRENGDVVSGRMDAHNLIGFQDPASSEQRIAIFHGAVTDPAQVIGFYPVFSDIEIGRPVFALESPVISAQVW